MTPLLPRLRGGLYIIIARSQITEASYEQICRSLTYMLKRQKLLTPPNEDVQV